MPVKPVKVSQLNNYIGKLINTDPLIGNVRVTGEISNLKYHSSGHIYFSLKDESSSIRCFFPNSNAKALRYELVDGMQVVVLGFVSVYEKGGYYSLNIRQLEAEGKGALAIAFERIKEKLEQDGIFDPSNKKPIPEFPDKIAIITSATGAALQDMLKIIKSKNTVTDILIYPVAVQGAGAAEEIAFAIMDINQRFKDVDTIIVGRGGGSQEDLWAFNEEIVARAIFDSEIPIISAVGHETDFSISDFAADVRAETPTAAAHMAVYNSIKLAENLKYAREEMKRSVLYLLERYRLRFESLKAQLESLDPKRAKRMGLAAITDTDEKPIKSIKDASVSDILYINLADGRFIVEVKEIKEFDKNGNL